MKQYAQIRNGNVIDLHYVFPDISEMIPGDSYELIDKDRAEQISRDITRRLFETSGGFR